MDRRRFLKGVGVLTLLAAQERRGPNRREPDADIVVDPDVLEEIRAENPELAERDFVEEYDKAVRNCITFDFDAETPTAEAGE
jgi:hypothetical protein